MSGAFLGSARAPTCWPEGAPLATERVQMGVALVVVELNRKNKEDTAKKEKEAAEKQAIRELHERHLSTETVSRRTGEGGPGNCCWPAAWPACLAGFAAKCPVQADGSPRLQLVRSGGSVLASACELRLCRPGFRPQCLPKLSLALAGASGAAAANGAADGPDGAAHE